MDKLKEATKKSLLNQCKELIKKRHKGEVQDLLKDMIAYLESG